MTDNEVNFLAEEVANQITPSLVEEPVYRVLYKGTPIMGKSGKSVWATKQGASRALTDTVNEWAGYAASQLHKDRMQQIPTFHLGYRVAQKQTVTFDSWDQGQEFLRLLREKMRKQLTIQEYS